LRQKKNARSSPSNEENSNVPSSSTIRYVAVQGGTPIYLRAWAGPRQASRTSATSRGSWERPAVGLASSNIQHTIEVAPAAIKAEVEKIRRRCRRVSTSRSRYSRSHRAQRDEVTETLLIAFVLVVSSLPLLPDAAKRAHPTLVIPTSIIWHS